MVEEDNVHALPLLQQEPDQREGQQGTNCQQYDIQAGKEQHDLRHARTVHLADGYLLLTTLGVERNAGVYTQQGDENADDGKEQHDVLQRVFQRLAVVDVVEQCADPYRYAFGQSLTEQLLYPGLDFLYPATVALQIAVPDVVGYIIGKENVTDAFPIGVGLERRTDAAYAIVVLRVVKRHPQYVFLHPLLPGTVGHDVGFRLRSASLLQQDIHEGEEIGGDTHHFNFYP
ncbi:unknown [Bacteroides sp. CAG:633]|nr:unknown [Bacteroides sp. CAG:633]